MMYRYFLLTLLPLLLILGGCEHRQLPESVANLDDQTVQVLMEERNQAVRNLKIFQMRGALARDLVATFVTPDGFRFQEGYDQISRKMDTYHQTGKKFEIEIKGRAILVSGDRQSAMVVRTVRETWLFENTYDDVSVEVVQQFNWALIDGVPQIVK